MSNKKSSAISQQGVQKFARAFYHSVKGDRLEPIIAEFRMVSELFRAYPDLSQVLNHILLSEEEKHKILNKVLETCSVSQEMSSFLMALVNRGHVDWLEDIFESVQALIDKDNNKVLAEVKAAIKLTEVQREKLQQRLEFMTGKQVELSVEYDPSIIGGIVAQVGDRIFDSSVQNRLAMLKDKMSYSYNESKA